MLWEYLVEWTAPKIWMSRERWGARCGVRGRVGGGGLENPPGPGDEGKSFTGENY